MNLTFCETLGWVQTRTRSEAGQEPVSQRAHMLVMTRFSTLSTQSAELQPLGPPLSVSASMQIDPPAVTWPVYQTHRGVTTRRKKGCAG